jgi:5-methyltetrahydropteroyltriglutamate--homocysteine methyltransferase
MQRSVGAMLTTHVGSLPRPDDLVDLLYARENADDVSGGSVPAALPGRVRAAVAESVRQQIDAGLDVVNDGEMSKVSYSTYVSARLTGFDSHVQAQRYPRADAAAFPRYAEWNARQQQGAARIKRYACTGPVRYVGQAELRADLDNLRAALGDAPDREAFMTAASPGVIAWFQPNQYYASDVEYLEALAEAMREEYEAIVNAGFVLQLDCPDVALSWNVPSSASVAPIGLRIEALNAAVRSIPADRMRLHLCWGNYEGPHQTDVPLRNILGDVLLARPQAISFEGANPRHEHEYAVFGEVQLPPDKIIIPGVLDTTTNYIEHPELVAQRLMRYAELVGPERVIAGADCGFGTFAGTPMVHPDIVFAKLQAMVEGAQLATERLFH